MAVQAALFHFLVVLLSATEKNAVPVVRLAFDPHSPRGHFVNQFPDPGVVLVGGELAPCHHQARGVALIRVHEDRVWDADAAAAANGALLLCSASSATERLRAPEAIYRDWL